MKMSNIKKILALVLALVMVLALCACGNSSTPAPSEETQAPAEETQAPAEENTSTLVYATSTFGQKFSPFFYTTAYDEEVVSNFTGGLLALMMTGNPISTVALIGFIILAGIVVSSTSTSSLPRQAVTTLTSPSGTKPLRPHSGQALTPQAQSWHRKSLTPLSAATTPTSTPASSKQLPMR